MIIIILLRDISQCKVDNVSDSLIRNTRKSYKVTFLRYKKKVIEFWQLDLSATGIRIMPFVTSWNFFDMKQYITLIFSYNYNNHTHIKVTRKRSSPFQPPGEHSEIPSIYSTLEQ